MLSDEWTNLTFTAEGVGGQEEFVLSVNDSWGIRGINMAPAVGEQSSGTFGPVSGTATPSSTAARCGMVG